MKTSENNYIIQANGSTLISTDGTYSYSENPAEYGFQTCFFKTIKQANAFIEAKKITGATVIPFSPVAKVDIIRCAELEKSGQ